MSVVSAPLDTRLLLCGLIQPHAIKQQSYCMQGQGGVMAQLRVSSILPSHLSSPPRLSAAHALLSRHTGTQYTHHREPRGLRCLEVNRIIWSCSVLTLRQLKFHNRRRFSHNLFFLFCPSLHSSAIHSFHSLSCRLPSCSGPCSVHLFQPRSTS